MVFGFNFYRGFGFFGQYKAKTAAVKKIPCSWVKDTV
jgi:hypothetical protein